jgi:predicted dehydrogenase
MTPAPSPLKLGIVTVEPHGTPWAEVLRGMPDVALTRVWDYDEARAHAFAQQYGIPGVAREVREMLGQVDAVLIAGGRRPPTGDGIWGEEPDDHLRLSRPFLEAGLPVLIDKPFADKLEDAVEMVRLARRHGALLMACSAMRYDSEAQALRDVVADGGLGKISGAVCMIGTGVATLKWYVIHIMEAVYLAFGPGIETAFALPSHAPIVVGKGRAPGAYGMVFRWRDGRVVTVLMVCDDTDAAVGSERDGRAQRVLWPTTTVIPPYLPLHYNVRVYGDMNFAEMRPVGKGCYRRKLEAFINMVRTGKEAIPLEQMLELTQAIVAAERSIATGKPESLRPVEELLAPA